MKVDKLKMKVKNKVKLTRTVRYEPVVETSLVDLPAETCYYFLGGIRKSYKIIPIFQDWDGGDGSLYKYDIIEVGLSFECIIERSHVVIHNIPNILKNTKHKLYHIINHIIEYPDEKTRTKEQFDSDLNSAIEKILE